MLARMTVDCVIRLIHGVGERVDDVFLWRVIVCVADGLGAELRGDLTRCMATHAITHHKKRATILEDILFLWHAVRDVILIAFALATHIGEFGHREAELLGHQSFLRLPTSMRSRSSPVRGPSYTCQPESATRHRTEVRRGTQGYASRAVAPSDQGLIVHNEPEGKKGLLAPAHSHTRF
jgi:hypothetical protein